MIGRILVIVMLLQLAVTSVFSHTLVSVDQCSERSAGHSHMAASHDTGDGFVTSDIVSPDMVVTLHCAGQPCTEKSGPDLMAVTAGDFRTVVLHVAEPKLTLQSVLRPHLRPPLG
ncbi:MAG: hypothetical protein ABNH26_00390 [Celeribacter sp.]